MPDSIGSGCTFRLPNLKNPDPVGMSVAIKFDGLIFNFGDGR